MECFVYRDWMLAWNVLYIYRDWTLAWNVLCIRIGRKRGMFCI